MFGERELAFCAIVCLFAFVFVCFGAIVFLFVFALFCFLCAIVNILWIENEDNLPLNGIWKTVRMALSLSVCIV